MSWEIIEMSEIMDLQNGFAFNSEDYVDHSNVYNCRMGNIRPGGNFDLNYNPKFLPDDFAIKYSQFLLKEGDIIVAMTDLANDPKILGVPTIVKENGKSILLNQRVGKLILKEKDKVYIPFLKYALNRKEVQSYFAKFSNGGLQINLGKKDLLSYKLPLPPLSIQKKIADILDKADALRKKDQQLLQKYDELAQAIFIDMFGDPVKNEKGWEIKPLGTKFKSIRYGTGSPPKYSKCGIPFIRATNIKAGAIVKKGMVYLDQEEAMKIEKCFINEGDLIVVRSGVNTGDCGIITKEYHRCLAGYDLIIEMDFPFSTFYHYLINSVWGQRMIKPLSRRAAQPHLNSDQLKNIEFISPPCEIQAKFKQRMDEISIMKNHSESILEKSNELFQSLLQQAFKGELIA